MIGSLYEYYFVTTGNSTSVADATIIKEVEKVGIPAVAIPYPVGNPHETKEKEREFRTAIVQNALNSLQQKY